MSSKDFDNLLVVGFDGLDYEKIKKYECSNLIQQSFGRIDTEGIELETPKLWASMITGKKPDKHGIDMMLSFKGEKARNFDRKISRFFGLFDMSALHLRKTLGYYIFDDSMVPQDKRFLEVNSVFEEVADSKAFDIPGYSEYPYIAGKMNVGPLTRKHPPASQERVKRDIDAEHLYRKKQLMNNIGNFTFLMQHLHYSDWHQHMFLSEEKDRKLYQEMDKLAEEILDNVDEDTLVLFCSDHGLEGGGHRDQAFYSLNAELDGEIKITNLLEKSLSKVDYQEEEETVDRIEV